MSNSSTDFSIVIPTRNGAATLAKTIQSALAQTYPRFEVVILESGSTDTTLDIIRGFDDPRLRLLSAPESLDIHANWARMLDLPLRPYLTILGHDDVFYPDFLAEIAALIERYPDASLYHTHFDLIDADDHVIRPCKPFPERESGEAFLQARQRYERDIFATGYVMRSADYVRLGGFPPFPRLYYADDFCFYQLGAVSGVACSPKSAFGYRYHRVSAAYAIDLLTLYEASRQYLSALNQTAYGESESNRALARGFVEKTFARRYHRLLYDLFADGSRDAITRYKHDKRELFARAEQDKLFAIYDPASAALDRLLDLPLGALKRGVVGAIRAFAVASRGIRK